MSIECKLESIKPTEKTIKAVSARINNPEGGWEWYRSDVPLTEHCVLAFMKGVLQAETAMALSGLSEVEFAQMVQDKAMERDLPVFRDYLAGKPVRDQLPFSEEKSSRFKELMAEELE